MLRRYSKNEAHIIQSLINLQEQQHHDLLGLQKQQIDMYTKITEALKPGWCSTEKFGLPSSEGVYLVERQAWTPEVLTLEKGHSPSLKRSLGPACDG